MTESFVQAMEAWKYITQLAESEEGKEVLQGSCINMHKIRLLRLHPETGEVVYLEEENKENEKKVKKYYEDNKNYLGKCKVINEDAVCNGKGFFEGDMCVDCHSETIKKQMVGHS